MTGPNPWFVGGGPGEDVPRIFCFPHAGGSPRTFADWQAELGGCAQVLGVCRPGKEHRSSEPSPTVFELIDGAADAIAGLSEADGRPFYLFGHSLGALVAFEVCRKLAGHAGLRHLIASGCSAPRLLPSQRVQQIARLSGAAFAEAVGFFGGLPAEVLADAELRDLLLPGVIADFRLAAGYRYRPGPKLGVPAVVIVGRDDPHVRAEQIEPWAEEFTWPPEVHMVDGGHFYFDPRPAAAIQLLSALIDADQHVELI
jgi:surfactin synthase thioesterase subunit